METAAIGLAVLVFGFVMLTKKSPGQTAAARAGAGTTGANTSGPAPRDAVDPGVQTGLAIGGAVNNFLATGFNAVFKDTSAAGRGTSAGQNQMGQDPGGTNPYTDSPEYWSDDVSPMDESSLDFSVNSNGESFSGSASDYGNGSGGYN